jgi:ABC-type multidrug transport system fused ATPase/permease subunit
MGKQIQVVDASGAYQESNVKGFVEEQQLSSRGTNYTTVAIMGPQSSGKSTLLNALVRLFSLEAMQSLQFSESAATSSSLLTSLHSLWTMG